MIDQQGEQKVFEELDQLKRDIHFHNYRYHVLDSPIISDYEYDQKLNRLNEIEGEHPEWISADSPSQRAGAQVSEKFEKVTHPAPVLSLANAFDGDDVKAWFERIKKLDKRVEQSSFVLEPKFDGLTVVLHYENGVFVQGTTRGDGVIGEDITTNLKTVQGIPLRIPLGTNGIPVPEYLVVRGEVLIYISEFEKLNKKMEESGEKAYVNPRNTAAGSLRQLDSTVTAKRPLEIFVYDVISISGELPETQWEILAYLKDLGFPVTKYIAKFDSVDELISEYDVWMERRGQLDFEIDGLVVKLNDQDVKNDLGFVGKDPRGAIAIKFPAQEVTTTLKDIGINVGRTGVLTPYAIFEPVEVGGVIVKQATLHNYDFITEKDIRIGDRVLIKRAGDVIPYVIGPILDARDGSEVIFKFPEKCPSCEQPVEHIEGEVAWYCVNSACPAQLIRNLEHFVSRQAMDIAGMGIKIVEQLIEEGLVKDVADIYFLRRNDLLNLEGFAGKKADNLLQAIKASKTQPLPRLINALGIRGIGEVTAQDIAKEFCTLDNLENAGSEELEAIDGVGPNMAQAVLDWFAIEGNLSIISKLKTANIWPVMEKEEVDSSQELQLSGMIFVVTGKLERYSRTGIKEVIQKFGGNVSSSISKKTDYLLAGEKAGSKLTKARDIGVNVIDEAQFDKLIGEEERQ